MRYQDLLVLADCIKITRLVDIVLLEMNDYEIGVFQARPGNEGFKLRCTKQYIILYLLMGKRTYVLGHEMLIEMDHN